MLARRRELETTQSRQPGYRLPVGFSEYQDPSGVDEALYLGCVRYDVRPSLPPSIGGECKTWTIGGGSLSCAAFIALASTTFGFIETMPMVGLVETLPAPVLADPEPVPGRYVHELRRLSGITWDQLARIFEVSRRTIHLWASGKPMAIANESKLHKLVGFLHFIDRGEASQNRAKLLSVGPDNLSVIELLRMDRFDDARAIVGAGGHVPPLNRAVPLSKEARAARAPLRPVDLIDTSSDTEHDTGGRLLRELSRPINRPK